jgi:hypothetical protein
VDVVQTLNADEVDEDWAVVVQVIRPRSINWHFMLL